MFKGPKRTRARFIPRAPKKYKKYNIPSLKWFPRPPYIPPVIQKQEEQVYIYKDIAHRNKYPVFAQTHDRVGYFWQKIDNLRGKDTKKARRGDCPVAYFKGAAKLAPDWFAVAKYLKGFGWVSHTVFVPDFCGHPVLFEPWMLQEITLMDKYPGRKRGFDIVFTIWQGCIDRHIDTTWVPMYLSDDCVKKNKKAWVKMHSTPSH